MKRIENIERLEFVKGGDWWNPGSLECMFAAPIGAFEVITNMLGSVSAGGRLVNCWNS